MRVAALCQQAPESPRRKGAGETENTKQSRCLALDQLRSHHWVHMLIPIRQKQTFEHTQSMRGVAGTTSQFQFTVIAHAPLGYSDLSFDLFLPHHAYSVYPRTFVSGGLVSTCAPSGGFVMAKCQARKNTGPTVRWPIILILLQKGPGMAVSVDFVAPLPVTPRGNTYIYPFTDRFIHRADMFVSHWSRIHS